MVVVLLTRGGDTTSNNDSVRTDLLAADCTVQIVNALQGDHSIAAPDGTSKKWNTDPPTSGPHNAQPAVFGAYTAPVNQAQLVHNLEHGGIAIQYGKDVPETTVAELRSFYDDHQAGTMLSPLDELGDQIAIGAWNVTSETNQKGILAKCPGFDQKAYTAFFDEYQFKGPERFSPEDLMPGR